SAEIPPGSPPRLLRREAARTVFGLERFEVETELGVEVLFETFLPKQTPELLKHERYFSPIAGSRKKRSIRNTASSQLLVSRALSSYNFPRRLLSATPHDRLIHLRCSRRSSAG